MAGYDHVRRLFRPAVVAVTAACVIGSSPGTSAATPGEGGTDGTGTPPTVAEVQREIGTLGHQLDSVTEQYNGAVIRLDKARKAQSAADATEKKLEVRLSQDLRKVATVASSTYRAGPLSGVTSMVSSGSPREFLDRLSMLDTLAKRRHQIIDGLRATKAKAQDASQAAHRSTAEAQKVAADLDAKKSWILDRLPKQQALLASLTAAQREQALDATGRASRATVRAPVGATPVTAAPASGRAAIAVAAAMSKLGSPYVWAAAGPNTFDCSGLMLWAWAQAGVALPHYTGDQYNMGTHVSRNELQPGDLVFFYPDLGHVGMYIGGGNVIHAPQPGDVVKISSVDSFPYAGATRVG